VRAGWSGVKKGKLLALASSRFDAFITADQNLEFQQNLSNLPIAVVFVIARRTCIQSIEPLVPELIRVLEMLPPRSLRCIDS